MAAEKRKYFVEKVMEMAKFDDFQRADEISQIVIKLIQETIGETIAIKVAESVPEDLKKGWDLIAQKEIWGKIGVLENRKDFVKKVMELAEIEDFKRADEISQVVIKLVQESISETISKQIAESVSPDLRKGWELIATARKGLIV